MKYLSNMKILYIEDDAETREALKRFLKRRTSKVIVSEDAETAIELFEQYSPDILIVDLLLPGMNGMEFIEKINRNSMLDSVGIIITTTVSEVQTIISAIEKDIDAYILKPLDMKELEDKLEHIATKIHKSSSDKNRLSTFADEENRGIIADTIRVEFIKLLKAKVGKGPSKVNVILGNDTIEIVVNDSLSTYEKTIIENIHNTTIMEQIRELFYKNILNSIESIILNASGINFISEKINIDIRRKIDLLTFTIK